MSDKKQRVDQDVIDMVKFMKKYILIEEKKRLDFSATIRDVFLRYMKDHNIIKKTDITEREILLNDGVLKLSRIDTNFSPMLRDKLDALSYFLDKEHITKKKLSREELMEVLYEKYIQEYPEFNKLLLEDKYIFQKIQLDKLSKNHGYILPDD